MIWVVRCGEEPSHFAWSPSGISPSHSQTLENNNRRKRERANFFLFFFVVVESRAPWQRGAVETLICIQLYTQRVTGAVECSRTTWLARNFVLHADDYKIQCLLTRMPATSSRRVRELQTVFWNYLLVRMPYTNDAFTSLLKITTSIEMNLYVNTKLGGSTDVIINI